MKNRILHISLVSLFLLVDFVAFAQPGDDDGSGGLEGNDPPPAPINGKLLWLGIAAVLFAFYSFRKYRKVA
ncbi:MAG: hypothetical protein IPP30_10670 [Flavobacterium sp.]|nr:hypothetical protein [Flavobacterium sp.]